MPASRFSLTQRYAVVVFLLFFWGFFMVSTGNYAIFFCDHTPKRFSQLPFRILFSVELAMVIVVPLYLMILGYRLVLPTILGREYEEITNNDKTPDDKMPKVQRKWAPKVTSSMMLLFVLQGCAFWFILILGSMEGPVELYPSFQGHKIFSYALVVALFIIGFSYFLFICVHTVLMFYLVIIMLIQRNFLTAMLSIGMILPSIFICLSSFTTVYD